MGTITAIIAGIVAIVGAIFGANALGKRKGREQADIAHRESEVARVVESNNRTVQAQVKVAENATNVQNQVNSLEPGSAADELRRDFSRD